jgi:hypothetical protein
MLPILLLILQLSSEVSLQLVAMEEANSAEAEARSRAAERAEAESRARGQAEAEVRRLESDNATLRAALMKCSPVSFPSALLSSVTPR